MPPGVTNHGIATALGALLRLDQFLLAATLSHTCPHCKFNVEKKGSWFRAKRGAYTCPWCGKLVPFGYRDKVALFRNHAEAIPAETVSSDGPL